MIDYAKLKVSEIKQLIVNEGYDISSVDVKGKAAWVELHKKVSGNMEETPEIFGEIEDDEEGDIFTELDGTFTPNGVMEEAEKTPRYSDPEWQDYVMSQFSEDELIDGKYPNVNGLRRVVELLLGEVIASGPVETQTTMLPDNVGKAVVTYEVTIEWKLDAKYDSMLNLTDKNIFPIKTFRSVASSHVGNTDEIYAVFPESIAETRAEGRALRRALRLGVVCSDELTKKDPTEFIRKQEEMKSLDENWAENITEQQINSITLMCDRLNIDVNKFINSGSKTYNDIKEISRSAAAGMLKRLNQYQTVGEESLVIPENLLLEKKE